MFKANDLTYAGNQRLAAAIKQKPTLYILGAVFALSLIIINLVTGYLLDFFQILLILLLVYTTLLTYHTKLYRKDFWTLFAFKHNSVDELIGDLNKERGLIFNHGQNAFRQIEHVVRFEYRGRTMRTLQYTYYIKMGGSKQEYRYTVFGLQFAGHFPHMYLNYTGDSISFIAGEEISLPQEFQDKYKLSAPKKYEIEALQIFSPELLTKILGSNLRCDIELLDNELLFLVRGEPSNEQELQEELDNIIEFSKLLAPKLDQFKYTPIGDNSPYLRPPIPI